MYQTLRNFVEKNSYVSSYWFDEYSFRLSTMSPIGFEDLMQTTNSYIKSKINKVELFRVRTIREMYPDMLPSYLIHLVQKDESRYDEVRIMDCQGRMTCAELNMISHSEAICDSCSSYMKIYVITKLLVENSNRNNWLCILPRDIKIYILMPYVIGSSYFNDFGEQY